MRDRVIRVTVAGLGVDAIASMAVVIEAVTLALQTHQALLMTFANPGTTVLAQRYDAFGLFARFDLVAADGIAMVKAIHWMHRLPAMRMSFDSTSLAPPICRLAVLHRSRVLLCGGRPGVAIRAGTQLMAAYPGLNIVGMLHGYDQPETLLAEVHGLRPNIVICGMGGLLQERFLLDLTRRGWSGVGFTCGGYLDQLSHGLHYYPKLVDTLNLRWAYRLAKEPQRLWRRYLLDYPLFAARLGKALIQRNQ